MSGRGLIFQLDSKAVRDPIHESKISRHEGCIEDGTVIPTRLAKARNIRFPTGPRLARKLDGEIQQSAFGLRDRSSCVVLDDRFDQLVVVSYTAETLRVVVNSIMALVDHGHDYGD